MNEQATTDATTLETIASYLESGIAGGALGAPLRDIASRLRASALAEATPEESTPAATEGAATEAPAEAAPASVKPSATMPLARRRGIRVESLGQLFPQG